MGFNDHANSHTNGHTNEHQDQVNVMNGHSELSSDTNGFSEQDAAHPFIDWRTKSHANEVANGTANGAHAVSPDSTHMPIAICGMGMRLPGGIHNDKALYDFLINKGDARSMVGEHRYNVDAYFSPHGKHGTISTKHGYFINDVDFSNFDISMFTLTSAEAEQVDPNHRLALEVVREAFESAGETEWRGKKIGTYVGMFSEDWQDLQHKDTHEYNHYRVLGGLDFALPNRIAYEYDLRGPRYAHRYNQLHKSLISR